MVVPTILDTKLIPKILAKVIKYGKTVDFVVPATKVHAPETGIVTETNPTTYSKKVTPPEPYIEGYAPPESIRVGDSKIYLPSSGLEFTPTRGYLVQFDSTKWRMENVNPIYTGEQIALYELQLRKL